MRTFEDRTIPARTESVLASIRCDLCGREAKDPENWSGGSCYEVDETTVRVEVKHREGSAYPEGSFIGSKHFDLCPTCFEEVLVPFLESKGAKPTIKDKYE